MDRRQVLKSLSAMTVLGMTPEANLLAKSLSNTTKYSDLTQVQQNFASALANEPALLGFTDVKSDFKPQELTIEGRWPKELTGAFYRNGPAKHERGGQRYKHLFEGDGMLQEFTMADGKVRHRGRFIQTPKFTQEHQAGKFLYSGPDSRLENSLGVASPNDINVANTNIIPVSEKLWALWEAGSPALVNKKSLDFEGYEVIGGTQSYGQSLKGVPFSAHPKIEANGDIWNFGLNPTGHIVLYHLGANGKVKKVKVIATQYQGAMLHDFLITDKNLLIILPSIKSKRSHKNDGFFSSIEFSKQLPMQVLLINKEDFSITKQYELPAGFAFHYGNAWEDKDGTVHFDASLYPDLSVLTALSDVMQGHDLQGATDAQNVLVTLHKNGSHSMLNTMVNSEFPRVFSQVTGLKNQTLFHVSNETGKMWSDRVSRFDLSSQSYQHYHFGDEYLVEEHIPIKGTGKQNYLLGTALNVPTKRTCLNVFNADALTDGPMARAWLPYHIPLGFHGNFVKG
ncbi:carotenoid oxygenase family protein [Paraglaciecola aquimarina]|uniref:Carotenoid oxygenase family protein n=1 Tax=Paraglaciecola algarum TaxID=3050085 RepID=A0ABS9D8V1_9ALTE|nr:carotenoid oxygenase family protein [Paraglaciecola sp. G1-23]MCF2949407.1 carotenoid oxygenase family protein [Paraglaciecola sp. G1-23]